MGYDFFRNNDERPESLKEESFTTNDMDDQTPDLFKQEEEPETQEEPEAEKEVVSSTEAEVEMKQEEEVVGEQAAETAEEIKEEIEDQIKKLNALYGEEKYEIPAEAKFTHKVDGEEVEVGLQELLNNYSGKQSWDKKYSELDQERGAYKKDLDAVNKYISKFAEVSKEDKVEGLIRLAEAVGINPLEYKKQLRSELLNKYGEYLQMDETQRLHYDQREELDYLRRQQENAAQKRASEQAQVELRNRYSEMQETHGIDDERLNYIATELQEVYKTEVNPENVLELHSSMVRLDRVDNALGKVDAKLLEDDQKVLQLESLLRGNPQITDEQLLDTATKLWGTDVDKAVVNLSKKVATEKKPPKIEKSHKFEQKLNHRGSNINFFE